MKMGYKTHIGVVLVLSPSGSTILCKKNNWSILVYFIFGNNAKPLQTVRLGSRGKVRKDTTTKEERTPLQRKKGLHYKRKKGLHYKVRKDSTAKGRKDSTAKEERTPL